MKPGRPHGFVAWIFDFYFLSYAGGALVALLLALVGRPGTISLALSLVGAILVASLGYHLLAAKRLKFVSPGEGVAGRALLDGKKEWVTYYDRSRWPLFGLALIAVVVSGNAWDGIGEGKLYTFRSVLFQAVVLAGLAASVVAAAKGRPVGLLGVSAYFLLMAFSTWFGMPSLMHEVRLALFFGFLGLGVLCLVISRWFGRSVTPRVRTAA